MVGASLRQSFPACIGQHLLTRASFNLAGAAAYRIDHQSRLPTWSVEPWELVYNFSIAGQLTRAIFYMALELGIMAVAINLPSIWVVFAKLGPESIICSVRSAISLASIGSHRSGGSHGSRGQSTESQKASTSISPAAPLPAGQFSKPGDDLEALEPARLDRVYVQQDVKVTKD